MYFVVSHAIQNTEDFWASAQRILPNLPQAGVKRVLNIFPNQQMDKCTCVWEADSVENLQQYLRENLGSASSESCYEVNEAAAVGLTD